MPWKEKTVEQSREEFVKRCLAKEKSKSALCREYGISRPTGDKWIKRFENGQTLTDVSRAPFRCPNKTAYKVETKFLELRGKHPALGAVKLRKMLDNNGEKNLPCVSTVNAILKRNGCITAEASKAATPYKRFEKRQPNEMWQTDFKGDFLLANKERCFPLCALDDCSRFSLCIDAKRNHRRETVEESFEHLFQEYGLPRILLCDNGSPWGTSQTFGMTKFEVWLMDLEILTIHGRVMHPQTQGKQERFNGSLKSELLKYEILQNMEDAQRKFDIYREFYNYERPHHALNLDVPARHYQKSSRRMPSKIVEWSYGTDYEIRAVKNRGYFKYKGQEYFISEALAGRPIGLIETNQPGYIDLHYRNFRIAKINLEERVVVSRRIYLLENDPRLAPNV